MKDILYCYKIGNFDLGYLVGLASACNLWEKVYFVFIYFYFRGWGWGVCRAPIRICGGHIRTCLFHSD